MQAVILAAGRGTRMRPLSSKLPKPLLQIGGQRILEHTIDQLQGIVDEVILVVGYRGRLIQKSFRDNYRGMKITYAWQKEQLGTGDAAQKALPYLKGPFLLLYGDDVYYKSDILEVIKYCPSLLLGKTNNPSQFGVVQIKGKWVTGIVEKPKNPRGSLVNAGVYFVDPSIFRIKLKKSKRGEYEFTDYIKTVLKKGKRVAFHVTDRWKPITTPENLREARLTRTPGSVT
ncbi:MAG: bifunctional UDP-N-acetylglucosamine pyrophosphorylase / Glucosamine-1-phosphate N-acetyltransferase [Parcubacteria group bacterium Greene0714_21]|nr:MAG: bifunctional UDP-N-acetylglucosamine pyrophosphorylase / Glucosamine-1-phosphate N-acetyltransferase [Parcubacteria group bacterium Greene0416_39]TSC98054.1 MAG: bifunctional UDP-N-acetylglucosamine pyrophosphorylase / Glucosamine-1-phosphate N-acetyltransferase [Parcubacteria group bacterium Greene1014_47]TSD04156.1 MAG: bifunctional UDP-N-acetylglucosamine pyrophosphorylase / Glucosamine-1-phosphate N-acetyltransferase [Parcubacteria group bacterium Greene0714_21]